MKLDLLKDNWFFTPKSAEENRAFQEWAFSQGMSWLSCGTGFVNSYSKSIGGNSFNEGQLGYASTGWYKSRGATEIFPKFLTKVVVEVELPDIESPQQKQIRELEETIARATQQIEALKKEI